MQNKLLSLFFVVAIVFTLAIPVMAEEIQPRADLYFGAATAYLAADKSVTFDCTTYAIHTSISITSVWLEQKIDGEWEYVKSLPTPSYVASNTISYVTDASYSSEIGTGTFRIGFTANADGHTITRNSNSRTF